MFSVQPYKPFKFIIICMSLLTFSVGISQTAISKLQYNRNDVNSTVVTITTTSQNASQMMVSVGQQFDSGTIFKVPRGTVVHLTTSNGNSQRLGPGSIHQVTVTNNGETHKTFSGRVIHNVRNKMNFYKASGTSDKYQLAVDGTIFSVEAVGKDIKVKTDEGRVMVQQKVPFIVKQQSQLINGSSRELYTYETAYMDADSPEAYYNYNAGQGISYGSYLDAINVFKNRLENDYYSGVDPYYLADQYSLLGSLYMDIARPDLALGPFIDALDLWLAIDPYNPLIGENYLDISEAYYNSGNREQGDRYWNTGVDIIDNLWNLKGFITL